MFWSGDDTSSAQAGLTLWSAALAVMTLWSGDDSFSAQAGKSDHVSGRDELGDSPDELDIDCRSFTLSF